MALNRGSSAERIKVIVHRVLNGTALQFWARPAVLSKKARKLPSCQLASHNALAVMPCCPLGGLRSSYGCQQVNGPGYICGAIILVQSFPLGERVIGVDFRAGGPRQQEQHRRKFEHRSLDRNGGEAIVITAKAHLDTVPFAGCRRSRCRGQLARAGA